MTKKQQIRNLNQVRYLLTLDIKKQGCSREENIPEGV